MAKWKWVTANTDGSETGLLTAATQRTATWKLGDSCVAGFHLDGKHPQAKLISELETDLILYRDTEKWLRGRLGSTSDALDSTGHDVTFSASDYRAVLAHRFLWPTTTLSTASLSGNTFAVTGQDQADIAWSLIDGTQNTLDAQSSSSAESSLNIVRGVVPETGILRDRTYYVGDCIGTQLDSLSQVAMGFDYEIDSELAFNLYYPARGTLKSTVLMFGGNVAKLTRTVDASTFANAQVVTDGQTDAYVPGVAEVDSDQFGVAGRWEAVDSDSSITDHDSATDSAMGALQVSAEIVPSYAVTLNPGWWTPDVLWLGDTAQIVIKSGRLNVNTLGRIQQVDLTLDDNDAETVVLTIGPFVPKLEDIVRHSARLLDRLKIR